MKVVVMLENPLDLVLVVEFIKDPDSNPALTINRGKINPML
jgi:hypothetical protein